MSIFKKLFGKRSEESSPSLQKPLECPSCHSQKVGLQFSHSDEDHSEQPQHRHSGGCKIMESGIMKKVCQECHHIWDEEEFDTPAFFMSKPNL